MKKSVPNINPAVVTPDRFGPSCPLPIERLVEEINLYKGLTCTVKKHTLQQVEIDGKRVFQYWEMEDHNWKLTITDGKKSRDFFVEHAVCRHGLPVEYIAGKFVREFDHGE